MNRTLKFFSILTIATLLGCSSSTSKKEITDANNGNQGNDQSNTQSSADVTIAETVLLDQDGVKVTATKLVNNTMFGKGISVLIENSTEKNIGVSCNSLIVNNYMISDLFSATVAAGKKSNETIELFSTSLEAAGIDTIADIIVSFHVFDADTFTGIFDTPEVTLPTSASGTVEQPMLDDGKELLNQDGIRIVGKYVDEDSFWGAGILLYLENNSGSNIIVQCDNMSINGFMVTPYFSSTVNQGRMAIDDITIMQSDLEKNNITSVQDVELQFKVINPDTFQNIFETDPITFAAQ